MLTTHRALKPTLLAACVALSFAMTTQALAMTKDEHKAAEDRIEADYKAAKQRCDGLKGNAEDVCEAEVGGNKKIAEAELEAQYKPSDKAQAKIIRAKADAAYEVEREKCGALTGQSKNACLKNARTANLAAKSQAMAPK